MKILFKILVLLLIGFTAKSQSTPLPYGLPSPYSRNWYRVGWNQSDSGTIFASRDTTLRPRFAGTTIFWSHPGVDSLTWLWDGFRWKKMGSGGGSGQPDTIIIQNTGVGYFMSRVVGDTAKFKSLSPGTNFSIDSVSIPGTYILNASGGASTPTLQQVFNTEVGGSVLTKKDSIIVSTTHNLNVISSGTSSAIQITTSGTGGGINILNSTSGTANAFNITNNGTGSSISINNAQTNNGDGITVTNASTINPAIRATGAYQGGVFITSASGAAGSTALQATAQNGSLTPATVFNTQDVSTTNVDVVSIFRRQMSGGGTPAAGVGVETDSYLPSVITNGLASAKFKTISTNVTDATYAADYHISLINAGSFPAADQFWLKSTGQLNLGAYGSGTITGTPAFNLAVDASHNVIEVATGGGGGGGAIDDSVTSASNTTLTLPAGKALYMIIVNPVSNTAAFNVGTVSGNGDIVSTQSITGGVNAIFIPNYYTTGGVTLFFTGITSSTFIKIKKL